MVLRGLTKWKRDDPDSFESKKQLKYLGKCGLTKWKRRLKEIKIQCQRYINHEFDFSAEMFYH